MTEHAAESPVVVLLVEDNPGDVRLIQAALKRCRVPCELHVAGDGEEAMDFLYRRGRFADAPRPGLVFLDLNLPKKSGHEVLAEIRCDEGLRNLPVVVLTASRDQEDVLRAYDLNCNCYLTKPAGAEEFSRLVELIRNFWLTTVVLPPGP